VARQLTLLDRLRIERAVWSLDFLVQDIPRPARRAIRRELRGNLRSAAADVGTPAAVRQLGNLRRLAAGYLDAEYGAGRPRPRWLKGLFWALAVESVSLSGWILGQSAFLAGVRATDPHATGVYGWHGWPGSWAINGTVIMVDGEVRGGSLTVYPLFLLLPTVGFVLGGRLWRLLRPLRRADRRPARTGTSTPVQTE